MDQMMVGKTSVISSSPRIDMGGIYPHRLNIDDVRRLATSSELVETSCQQETGWIWLVSKRGVKYNVWTTTGTVEVSKPGEKMPVFHRNCSLGVLQDIFEAQHIPVEAIEMTLRQRHKVKQYPNNKRQ